MRSEWKVERDAAKVAMQTVHDLSPEVRVGEPAVSEQERRSIAALEAIDHPCADLQPTGITEQLRSPAVGDQL